MWRWLNEKRFSVMDLVYGVLAYILFQFLWGVVLGLHDVGIIG